MNVIEQGSNYGWPFIAGMPDNNYSNSDAYPNNNALAGQTVTWSESAWSTTNNAKRPLFSFFNWPASNIPSSATDLFTWPTIAPSSIDFYSGNIPGWKNSLLVTSLKYGLYRLKLNADGSFVDSTVSTNLVDTFPLLHGWRVRDIAINPVANSGQFWVVIDSSGNTSGPTGGFTGVGDGPTKDGGKVLRLTYKTMLTLPVGHVKLTGRLLSSGTAELQWEMQATEKPLRIELEKSADGTTFVTLGTITTEEKWMDQPFTGNNYYRLRLVSSDGQVGYSNTVNIANQRADFVVHLYPNPVQHLLQVNINVSKTEPVRMQVADVAGRTVYSQTLLLRKGAQQLSINTTTWLPQVYQISFFNASGEVLRTQTFFKQ